MRHPFITIAAAACIAGSFFGGSRLLADDLDSLDKLRQEKLTAAEERYNAVMVGYEAGTNPIIDVYAASSGWKEAAYEIAKTQQERTTALERHRDRMVELYEKTHALALANAKGGEADKDAAARFWELEAKIWVREEPTKDARRAKLP